MDLTDVLKDHDYIVRADPNKVILNDHHYTARADDDNKDNDISDNIINISDDEQGIRDTRGISAPDNVVCQYPIGVSGSITITKNDIKTLDPGIYLNDTIIDFYLKYLYMGLLENSLQQNVHVFPVSFYTRLTRDPKEGSMMYMQEMSSNLSRAEIRYNRVQRWLREVNLLEKKLVLIPICEHAHWFMIVLVNPGGEEPCLLVLDSMGGGNTAATTVIKEFLIRLRCNSNLVQTHIRIICPSTPKQNNGFDCGIFVLHYAEKILCSVNQFAALAPRITNLDNWFSVSETNNKRQKISDLIRQLESEQQAPSQAEYSSKQGVHMEEYSISEDKQYNSCVGDQYRLIKSEQGQDTPSSPTYIHNSSDCQVSVSSQEDTAPTAATLKTKAKQRNQKPLKKPKKFMCSTCLTPMASFTCLRRHSCPILDITSTDPSPHLKVLDHSTHTDIASILLSCNTPRQIANICVAGEFCVKGGYPFLFPKQNQKLPILKRIGVVGADAHKKLKLAVSEGPIILRKILKIQIGSKVLQLEQDLTIPNTLRSTGNLEITDLGDSVEIKMISSTRGPRTGDRRLIKGSIPSSTSDSSIFHSSTSNSSTSSNSNTDQRTDTGIESTGGGGKGGSCGGDSGSDGEDDSRDDERDIRDHGSDSEGGGKKADIPPPQQFRMLNKHRHPEFYTREELRQRVKIFPHEFDKLCEDCRPASSSNNELSHKVGS